MQTVNSNYPKNPAYPGEYTPIQNKFEMLVEELDRLQEEPSTPPHNIYETSEYYNIELAAPGLEREDIFVAINVNGYLCISALHKDSERVEIGEYKKHTFNYECFNREFLLPETIDTDFVKAEYKKGILSFWFLKTEKPNTKRASIIIVY